MAKKRAEQREETFRSRESEGVRGTEFSSEVRSQTRDRLSSRQLSAACGQLPAVFGLLLPAACGRLPGNCLPKLSTFRGRKVLANS